MAFYNFNVPFRYLSSGSSRTVSRCRPGKTFLLVAAFAVSLMVIGGGGAEVQHAVKLGQVVASDPTPYHLTGDAWSILDLSAPQSGYAFAQTLGTSLTDGAFVTTWRTTSADKSITLPLIGSGMTVDWGDGNTTTASGSVSHTYNTAGDYTVQITGGLTGFHLNGATDASKLVSIDQWGTASWTYLQNAFRGAKNMVYNAGDVPNFSGVNDMSSMFFFTPSFNGNLSSWDVSSVTDMSNMFTLASSFNGNLSSWDVSSVTDMKRMFNDAASFNQPLNSWDVSSATRMDYMFRKAVSFNQPLNSWDVSSATGMSNTFQNITSFDQNLGNWYVTLDSDTIADTAIPGVVGTISAQNLPLRKHSPTYAIVDDDDLDADHFEIVSGNRLNMTSGVPGEYSINVTASGTNVFESGNNWRLLEIEVTGQIPDTMVTDLTVGAFVTTWRTTSADKSITLPLVGSGMTVNWGDGNTTTASGSVSHTYNVAGDHTIQITGGLTEFRLNGADDAPKLVSLDQWGDASWTSMENAFKGATNMVYNADDAPDLSGVTDMSGMFYKATVFDGDLSSWDVSSVTDMSEMFREAVTFNQPLNSWNVSSVTNMGGMFGTTIFNQPLNSWYVSSVTDMSHMFSDSTFNGNISSWDVSSVTDMSYMFYRSTFNGNISSWDVSSVTDMSYMFRSASFNGDISEWDVSNVTYMSYMLLDSHFNGNLGNWYITLDNASITGTPQAVRNITPQNEFLATHEPTYGIGSSSDSEHFGINGTALVLMTTPDANHATVNITSTGDFGTSNSRIFEITILPGVADTTNPRLASIERYNPSSQNTDSSSLVYKATFNENVTGVNTSDFVLSSVGSNAGTGSITRISGSGSVYDVTVSATQDGTYNLDLVSSGHGIRDAANNLLDNTAPTTGTDETYTVSTTVTDTTNPRLASIERYNPSSQNTDSSSLVYKATFNESVTGVDASDFVLSSVGSNAGTGSITRISGSGSVYDVTVSATQDGTYNLDLVSSGHGIRDAANNLLDNTAPTTGTDETYTVSTTVTDTTNPRLASIERFNPSSATTDSQSLVYVMTFSENVTGVSTDDFVMSSDSTGGVSNNNTDSGQFTQTRSPSSPITDNQSTSDTITVPDSGTATSVSVSINISHTYKGDLKVDLAAPDGTTKTLHNRSGGGANNIVQTYTPDFDGIEVQGDWTLKIRDNANGDSGTLNRWTLTVNYGGGTTTTTINPVTSISGSGSVYYARVPALQDGTYNLDLVFSGHNIADTASNPLTNASTTGADETYTVNTTVTDTTNPRLASIERYNPSSQNTDSSSLVYKATFNENVTGVDTSDFVLSSVGSNAGTGSITRISGSGSVYDVTVSATQDGTYNLDLVSSGHGIRDAANNLLDNTAPTTGTDETYTVSTTVTDTTNPRLASIERYNPSSQNTDSSSLVYKATFNESVTGVDASDFVLSSVGSNAGTGSITRISGSGSVYDVTVSATQDGTYNLDLVSSGHGIRDAANNLLDNTAPTTGTDETYTVSTTVTDTTNPRLASIERFNPSSATTDSSSLVYVMTFSENVTGVSTDDFVMSSDSTGGVSNNNTDSGQFTQTRSPSSPITDNQSTSDTITVPDSGTATSVSVSINISHTYKGDLKVDLAAPDGTTKTLHNRSGGGANNIVQTYTPDFDGIEVQGDWTLKIRDNANGDSGTLNRWTLTVNYGGGTTTTTTINPVTSISGSGSVYYARVPALQDGTYNLDLVFSGHNIADTASNPLTNASTTGADETYTVNTTVTDTTNPRLASIERYNPSSQNTDSSSLVYKATFNESVTGVDTSDFVLSSVGSNAGTGSITRISGSGSVYDVTVSATQDGTYNLDLVSSGHGIRDAANNLLDNTAPTTGTDETYTVSTTVTDTTNPRLASIERFNPSSATTDSQSLVYVMTFSENVTGVSTDDFVMSSDSTGGVSNNNTDSGQFTQTRSPSSPITDNQSTSDTITVPDSGTATSVSVSINISHTYKGDLKVDLAAPDGTTKTLHNRSGGGANNIVQTYTPDFDGIEVQGDWTLKIRDNANGDSGTLNRWTLTVNYGGGTTTTTTINPVTSISGSGSVYYARVPALHDGTYNLDLVFSGHNIADTASNPLTNASTTGADETYTVSTTVTDTTNPRLASIERYDPSSQNTDSSSLVYKATFNESVTGVDASDFVLSSVGSNAGTGSITRISGSGSVYDVTVSATQDGTYNLDLVSSGHGIRDAANNLLDNTAPTTGTDETYTVSTTVTDTTNPRLASIERFNPSSATTDSSSLVYVMTFSENVTGVSTDDFVMSSDSTGGVSNNNTDSGQFTQTRSPSSPITDNQSTSDTITVPDSGTATSVSVSINISHTYKGDLKVDLAAPDGTTKTLHNRSGGGANNIVQTYTPDFDGIEVQGDWTLKIRDNANGDSGTLNRWTLTVNYGGGTTTTTTINPVTSISGSGSVYYARVPALQDGTYNLDLVFSGHNIADTASNPLTNASTTGADETYTVNTTVTDTTNPRLASIERYNPSSQNTDSSSLVYKATFNESVTGVDASDFVLSSVGSNAGTGSITRISGSGSVYDVTVSATQDGTYNLDLVSSGHGIRDAANNLLDNTAPTTGTDETYTVSTTVTDTTNPRLASIERFNPSSATTDSSSLVYVMTFSENVTGVSTDDFVMSSDSTGGVSNNNTDSGQFTQTRSPSSPITDNQSTSDTITVPDSGTATSVSVSINISHTYKGDLKVDLAAPDGTTKTLHNRSGGGANNIVQTYTPDFDGIEVQGDWTLKIRDNANGDSGTLNRWTLTVNYGGGTTTTTTINPVTSISGSGSVYYARVPALQDGTYNLDLVFSGHNIADTASNPLTNASTTGADETYTVNTTVTDTTNPRLASIERYNPSSQNTDSSSLVYKATFNESVTGVDTSDFVLSSVGSNAGTGSITRISGSGSVYDVTVSATQDGTYNLDLVSSGHGIRDAANNLLDNTAPTTGTDETYTVSTTVTDTTNPRLASIERFNPSSATTDSSSLVYVMTFSENVTGVSTDDFVMSSDSTGGVSNNNTDSGQFTQTRSPSSPITDNQSTSDTITVPDSGTATSVSVSINISHTYKGDLKVDLAAPDGTTKTLHNRSGGGANNIVQTYTPDFDGIEVQGDWTLKIRDNANGDSGTLNRWTLTVNYGGGTTTTTINPVTSISGSGSVYYARVPALQDGTYNLDLVFSGHNIADTASNPLTNASTTGADETYTVNTTVTDTTNPRLASIERFNPSSQNTDSSSLVYKATFNENVTGVDTSDFVLSPTSTGGGGTTTTGQFTQTRSPNLAISDHQTVSDTMSVSNSGTATSISVAVDITHTYIGDLRIKLIAPDGTSRILRGYIGGGADDINKTYTPSFESVPISGAWILQIHDRASADTGVLNSWALTINYGTTTTTVSPVTGISGSSDTYYVTVSSTVDGTYNLDLMENSGIKDSADNPLTNTAATGADQTYIVTTN